jgi:small-conductance mechanosensitive channel
MFGLDFAVMGYEKYLYFLLLFILSLVVGSFAHTIVRNIFERKVGKKGAKIISKIVQYIIIFSGLAFGLYEILGFGLGSVFTTLGIAGIIVGLAAQQIIQNFLAGILISFSRLIEIEDWIEVSGFPKTGLGRVTDMGLLRTTVRDLDGGLVYIPNSLIFGGKVVNYTNSGFTREREQLTFKTTENFVKIKNIILGVVKRNDRILPTVSKVEEKETLKILKTLKLKKYIERRIDMSRFLPRVIIADLRDGKMTVEIEYWIRDVSNRKYIKSEMLRELNEEFKKSNISII